MATDEKKKIILYFLDVISLVGTISEKSLKLLPLDVIPIKDDTVAEN